MEEVEEGWDSLTIASGLVIIGFVLFMVRRFIKGAQFTEKVSVKGKVALVTGASSGIGRQIAKELNLKGVKVYLLVRDIGRGNDAVRWMVKYGCDTTRLLVRQCDLDDFENVKKFVSDFDKEEDHVDILINNAGCMFIPKFTTTKDGNEKVLQSNYLGHFLLTELLLPKLEAAPSARIVNVSSALHTRADTTDLERMNKKQEYGVVSSYARSKLANVLHAVEFTKRLRRRSSGTKITINSCHPGAVDTDLVRIPIYQNFVKKIFKVFIWFFMKTDQDGAQTPLFCALSKKLEGVSGKYFADCAEAKPHPWASDDDKAEVLYNQSLEFCKIQPN
ncbi:unnamed protein product [Bursaphelenchus xylophilus]|uniref:(pine wood nematode) hypothetical protein n=1 Tax=Bursaphelenchus xylophilus TaxID=6326 RepID=A0A1I7RKC3_BURXY|nr:unnamed protein product [Bursaphelenchus xylophilus]CAG9131384.1 unnamed protein product [Bursaphelenchus xylophilus]